MTSPFERLLTTTEAAARVQVSPGTVRSWASRQLLCARDVQAGRPLYLEADVLEVERATRRAPRRSRIIAASFATLPAAAEVCPR